MSDSNQPFIPFTRPSFNQETIDAVSEVLRSGWVTSGPKLAEFEASLSTYFGGRPVRCFANGTATMKIALQVAGIGEGDEVRVSCRGKDAEAVLQALVAEGDLVLFDRNNHKAAHHGALFLGNGIPIYLETDRNAHGLIGPIFHEALDEAAIPLPPAVQGACELMGLDPLYLANEGKLLALCHPDDVDTLLAAMRAHPLGAQACCIGTVTEDPHHFVQMRTAFGGCRMLDWLMGDPLPRIC